MPSALRNQIELIQSLTVSGHGSSSDSIELPVLCLVKQKEAERALSRVASSGGGVLSRSPRSSPGLPVLVVRLGMPAIVRYSFRF
ncbi:MAG: hypothetical protein GWP10_05500 [Nitrospiraceae bacterium]|nr:hypothetical protein [Nitrospiraceae bacterium]